jgi:hypothetical protein
MKTLTLSVLAGGALALASLVPISVALAQDEPPAVAADHGNWTLGQREDWLNTRLDQARDDGSLDHHEYDRVKHELHDIHDDADQMRHHQHGELTDNQTADLEGRLDKVSDQIHWLHEHSFTRPW